MARVDQLSLFSAGFSAAGGPDPCGPAAIVTEAQRALAARLPSSLFLGTSSFTYPGWAGLVYAGQPSKDKLVERGLEAYARHPLLRTVSIDRSYYAPLSADDWRGYARQLPGQFRTVAKAWLELTMAFFPDHPRYGDRAGQINPRFLDPQLALGSVARPYFDGLGELAGPLVLELAPIPARLIPSERDFLARLAVLLDALPRPIAVELRTPQLLTPRYLELLQTRGVSHVLSFWSGMPTPGEQARLGADEVGDDLVFRLLQPPGSSYEGLRDAYTPFDRLRDEQPRLRSEVVAITWRALARSRRAFVVVGNKAEGCAPLTVFALAELLAGAGAEAAQ